MANVILLTVDCFRYDRCGFNGHDRNTTPTLDALANEAVVFDNAYSTGPYTTESFPGIIAGQHSYNGSYYSDSPAWKAIQPDSETLATHLKGEGYSTVATLTNPHLISDRNFHQGFDSFYNLRTQDQGEQVAADDVDDDKESAKMESLESAVRERMRSFSTVFNPYSAMFVAHRYSQLRTDWPTISAEDVLSQFMDDLVDVDGPFFGWTHLMDLHAPISPDRTNKGGLASTSSTLRQILWDSARASNIHEARYNTLYDSVLRYVDTKIAELIDALKQQGRWEDTILIVTGDHGEALYDRGFYGHPRHNLHEEAVHVPLLVRAPSLEGKRIETEFSLAWIHDLISELLNVESGDFPSTSDVTWFAESEPNPPVVVSDSLDGSRHTVGVRDGESVVITHQGEQPSEPHFQYYDQPVKYRYRGDRRERVPARAQDGVLLEEAKSLLTEPSQLEEVGGSFSPEVERRLEDLGYKM